jgi:uncharacterized membrane protein
VSELTRAQRASDVVTWFCGSWTFVIAFAVFTAVWIAMNTVWHATFDQYPFILLNLVFTVVELFQGPLILMSQNRQAEREREAERVQAERDREAVRLMGDALQVLDGKLDRLLRR